jgi:hypothetical protein
MAFLTFYWCRASLNIRVLSKPEAAMEISRAEDGKTVIRLTSWEEIGLRIVLPMPKDRIQPEDLGLNLQKLPIEVVIAPGGEVRDDDGAVFFADVEPEYCEHGILSSVSVHVSNPDASIDMSFLTYPVDSPDDHDEEDGY